MFYAGLDFGTSGVRLCIIDNQQQMIAEEKINYAGYTVCDQQTGEGWWCACCHLFRKIPEKIRKRIGYLSVDGTSGTVLLVDQQGEAITNPLLYSDHDADFSWQDKDLTKRSDAFIRVLRLLEQVGFGAKKHSNDIRIVTQADFIKGKLTASFFTSDQNNCFKLGYDCMARAWPAWMADFGITSRMLPKVLVSGERAAQISPLVAAELSLNRKLQLIAGTTDSVAAVMATGIDQTGSAVTSLGSTLVVKILSNYPVEAPEYGVYSQPYFDQWLVGGASNCGGRILRKYFDDASMLLMSQQLDLQRPTGIHYYPLAHKGERFPVNDPDKIPLLTPRPKDDVVFFQALLESLTEIERKGYQRLRQLGAPEITQVITVGGGSHNEPWTKYREQVLGLPVIPSVQTEAAYGTALLAMRASKRGLH